MKRKSTAVFDIRADPIFEKRNSLSICLVVHHFDAMIKCGTKENEDRN